MAGSSARGIVMVFLTSLLPASIPTIFHVAPPPFFHDEFAYQLAADTFAHGRLTNPPHRLWQHFETIHELMQPTYMAKFPPGQGMALAAGRLLGSERAGAFVTVALGCAAICWMLQGWIPNRWALFGGMLAVMHPTIFWWGQTYWGGGVAMLGGALLGGAIARAMREPKIRWGIVAGLGMAILANSRPFEGALYALMLVIVLLLASRKPAQLRRTLVPAAMVMLPVLAWMSYYNFRVTGSPLTMPYVTHARQYMAAPLFWWQPPPPNPVYRHDKIEEFYTVFEFAEYDKQRTVGGFLAGIWNKWRTIGREFLTPLSMAGLLLALPWVFRRTRVSRIAVIICLSLPALHMLLTPWMRTQYLAPAAGFLFVVLALCARQMARWKPIGIFLVAAVLIAQGITMIVVLVQMFQNPNPAGNARANLLRDLETQPGMQLVIVRYGPGRQQLLDWVYNEADIDAAKVVWARQMDPQSNARLLEYFDYRRVWLLSVDNLRYSLDPLR